MCINLHVIQRKRSSYLVDFPLNIETEKILSVEPVSLYRWNKDFPRDEKAKIKNSQSLGDSTSKIVFMDDEQQKREFVVAEKPSFIKQYMNKPQVAASAK